MSNLKITYFNAEGRAEPIRLALFIGGIEFDDERIDFPELQKRKPNLPFGSLPVLTTGEGEIIAQSNAVLRYAGRLAKLYPQDNLQATRVDELIDAVEDLLSKVNPIIYGQLNEEAKKQGLEKINTEILPQWVNLLEKRIQKYGKGGYAVGDQLTVIDLKLAVIFGSIIVGKGAFTGISGESVKNAPGLLGVYNKVKEHPKVVEWNKKHEPTNY
eukprot:TRINITY_DN95_c0_g3_i1.p1 TRINITY_DN95_c0_g3~~TRINITY_DN95_c0_g3_i1.p1  ORF type:complete len:214 (+),score=81.93 TRINITY_DN95_c0_g3_i1:72-713(+)